MKLEQVQALFLLADIKVLGFKQIPNGYWPTAYVEMREQNPWWLVTTERGIIEIGWRKSVISIEWSDTGIVFPLKVPEGAIKTVYDNHIVLNDNTMWETGSHAYGYSEALKQLSAFKWVWERFDYLNSIFVIEKAKLDEYRISAEKASWFEGPQPSDRNSETFFVEATSRTHAIETFLKDHKGYWVRSVFLNSEYVDSMRKHGLEA